MATPADGSIVYFSISQPEAGSGDPVQGRIYTVGPSGLELFAEIERQLPTTGIGASNHYDLSRPAVSRDGSIQAFVARRFCNDRVCANPQERVIGQRVTILGAPFTEVLPGSSQVDFSANGRFALSTSVAVGTSVSLIDLETGVRSEVYRRFPEFGHYRASVANDGTVILSGLPSVELVNGDKLERLTDPDQEIAEAGAIIDPAGARVVYVARWRYPHNAFTRLRVHDIAQAQNRTLIEGLGDFSQPVISDDGKKVLFLTTAQFQRERRVGLPQVYIIGIDRSERRALTDEPSGVRTATLSGNGRVAFATTGDGRLIRIEVDTRVTTELLPRLVNLAPVGARCCRDRNSYVSGSHSRFGGLGYLRPDGTPEPFRILFEGLEAPIVDSSPGEVWFQVPWELAERRTVPLHVEAEPPPGPFEQPWPGQATVGITDASPCVFKLPLEYGTQAAFGAPRFAMAMPADFSRLITASHPAQAGQVINFFGTGFGAVDYPVPTGEPAPLTTLSRLTADYACQAHGGGEPKDAEVLFAGLAPGKIGTYQIQVQLPPELPEQVEAPGALLIRCEGRGGRSVVNFEAVLPVSQE